MPSDKELSARLKATLLARVTPLLTELGFTPFGRTRKGKLPFRYWRERGDAVDMLEFQWDKYNRPRFIFNFRPVEQERDIARFKANPRENWHHFYSSYFRAGAGRGLGEKWFGVSLLGRLFPDRAIRRTVEHACQRMLEIDCFLSGDHPSPYLREIRHDYVEWSEEFFHPPSRTIKR